MPTYRAFFLTICALAILNGFAVFLPAPPCFADSPGETKAIRFTASKKPQNVAAAIPPELRAPRYRVREVTGIGRDPSCDRGDPSNVIKVGDLYHVWYTRFAPRTDIFSGTVYHAASADGIQWKEQDQAIVQGKRGEWDSYGVITPYVAVVENKYYLYYTGSALEDRAAARPKMRHIGVAIATDPGGPWTKQAQHVLSPGKTGAWDSLLVDDAHVIVRDGRYWLYYKGGAPGVTAETTKWGLAIADSPEGPYTKLAGNPVLGSGHTVCVWPHRRGVAALVDNAGPERHTVQYAPDGIRFHRAARVDWVDVGCGPYDPDAFTNAAHGRGITWGITAKCEKKRFRLVRFEVDCAVPGETASR